MTPRTAILALVVLAVAVLIAGCPKQTDTEVGQTEPAVQPPPAPPAPAPAAEGGAAKAESGPAPDAAKAESGAAPETAQAGAGAAADAEALMMDRCTQCHGIDKVEKEKTDAEEWGRIVKRMQDHAVKGNKTPITDDEAKQIVEHILANAGQ